MSEPQLDLPKLRETLETIGADSLTEDQKFHITLLLQTNIEKLTPEEVTCLKKYHEAKTKNDVWWNPDAYFTEKGIFLHAILADDIIQKCGPFKNIYDGIATKAQAMKNPPDTYYFDKRGIWLPAKCVIEYHVENALKTESNNHRVAEVVGSISRRGLPEFADDLNPPQNLICLKNGIYDLDLQTFQPHSPNYFFRNQIPVEYKPDAKCPEIDKFLASFELEEKDLQTILEMFASTMLRHYQHKTALMLLGPTDAGKTQLIRLLNAFLGRENITSVSLQQLAERFYAANLYLKLANTLADMPRIAIRDVGSFKMLTGEDYVLAEKKSKDGFSFLNYAKLIFSTNRLPKIGHQEDPNSFFNRWAIIKFHKTFERDNPERDEHIQDKITTPKELSGFLNKLLPIARIVNAAGITPSSEISETRKEWMVSSDTIASFVIEQLEADTNGLGELKTDIDLAYKNYCAEEGERPAASSTFKDGFKQAVATLLNVKTEVWQPGTGGNKPRRWKNVKLKGIPVETSKTNPFESDYF